MKPDCAKNPLICVLFFLLTGIIFGKYIISFPLSLYVAIIFLLLSIILRKKNTNRYLLAGLLIFAFVVRYNLAVDILSVDHLISYPVKEIRSFTGTITNCRYKENNRNQYILECDSILLQNEMTSATGKVLLRTVNIKKRLIYGSYINVKTKLEIPSAKRNPGQFDYREYLTAEKIFRLATITSLDSITLIAKNKASYFQDAIFIPVKKYCQTAFHDHLSQSCGAIMNALLLGEKQNIDRLTIQKFQKVGVVHVLAISGLHVGYVVLFVFTALSILRFSTNIRIITLAVILLLYIILVAFKPPVMRASIMVLLYFWGKLMGHKINTGNIISGAAIIILLVDPQELFNPGFQFSFGAVISIIYGWRKLDALIPLKKKIANNKFLLNGIWNPLLVSLSAVWGTLPLTIYYYGTIPIIALFANIIVIPLIGAIVLLGFFLLIIHGISGVIADGIGTMIDYIYQFLVWITGLFARIPFASVDVAKPSLLVISLMVFGFLIIINLNKRFIQRIVPYYASLVLIYLLIKLIPSPAVLEVAFLDVGQGDATYFKFPNEKTMVVDAGDASASWDHGILTLLPFLKQKGDLRITYLIGSHPHDDHIGGFVSLLNRVQVDTLVMSKYLFFTSTYVEIMRLCSLKNIPVLQIQKGDILNVDPSCRVYVLHPDSIHATYNRGNGAECNNSSLVLKIQYGKNAVLLTGDLEHEAEPEYFLRSKAA